MKAIKVIKDENYIDIFLIIDDPKMITIGEKMKKQCQEADMNGYNWEAFLKAYIKVKDPVILKKMDTDPEAETLSIIFKGHDETTWTMADKMVNIIKTLICNTKFFNMIFI